MHLLATVPGAVSDGSAAVDLGQTRGDIVVFSAADSDLSCLAAAQKMLTAGSSDWPSLRLASLLKLNHHYSVDLYLDSVASHAKLIVARILGGRGYWNYGVEQLSALARERGIALALLPGDDQPDAELARASTVEAAMLHRLWRYLAEGGAANAEQFLRCAASLTGRDGEWREPAPVLRAGLYWPGATMPDLEQIKTHWQDGAPVAALVFYRALVLAANTAPVDALIAALQARGINPLPLYVASLKDAQAASILAANLGAATPDIVLNATAFAVSTGEADADGPFAPFDCPVLQVIFSGGSEEAWRAGARGLDARDIAMNVALPELDGRIVTRAVSFKAATHDERTQADLTLYRPVPDRIEFVADLTRNWTTLRRTPKAERRIALVLANYPHRDGRIGNGVGLDTPASAIAVLHALKAQGYRVENIPADGDALIHRLLDGPTNAKPTREADETFARSDYEMFLSSVPRGAQEQIDARWGAIETDKLFRESRLDCGAFAIPAIRCGNVVIGVQPSRGYDLDPKTSYHAPDLPPPHGYLAFHAWLADSVRAQAIIHLGKHGNLEWLPGKALALSSSCFPEIALGPIPHLYPFIVNDPGEGTQAKRRAQAVIVDHLTPPLARAESYGRLGELERLVDEYYAAAQGDPRRVKLLGAQILELVRDSGIDRDCGIAPSESDAKALQTLDSYLCELKEMQIRDGLHVFGQSPDSAELLVALVRLSRGPKPHQASLIRALADDLELGFDPLAAELGEAWRGPKPSVLAGGEAWRNTGDTVERLELLARDLVAGTHKADPSWTRSLAVLDWVATDLKPTIAACGKAEIDGLLAGLDGRFVRPGPSGAPSRGRPEVLPTGRNFFSLDSRAMPTPAAWQLGWKSAGLLIQRYAQDHGVYPKSLALSAWGTSNMRTGGDDIAQGLALMGVRPVWEDRTGRVTGFEILPSSILDRPRVDVTLRVSGFFRDAFPGLIDLFDSAARAVATLDENAAINPLAARVKTDRAALEAQGLSPDDAARRAGFRIFGSRPGAYGTGLQTLIDEGGWDSDGDLAEAYLNWGGFAYGAGAQGDEAQGLFRARLKTVEAVVQNQDNREHDVLDSDDYYQFEGGLAAAVRHISGTAPALYHGDHSRPDTPRIRTLEDEIGRVVHARAANPKWLKGVMRHGYKGAFEIAATVDYLFAFAATAHAVKDHHFDALYDAYLGDAVVHEFLSLHNPDALKEIEQRFAEAIRRGLWHPKRNAVRLHLEIDS